MSAPNWKRLLARTQLDEPAIRALFDNRAICTHQHRIDLAQAPGIQGSHFSAAVKRDWSVANLRAATKRAGVTRRVLVAVVDPWDGDPQQQGVNLGDVEADALSDLCAEHEDCVSCVVSVDISAPKEQVGERMTELANRPGVSGLRLIHTQMTPVGENPFAAANFLDYCKLAAANRLTVELLCREALGHYPFVLELLERFGGDWPVIINHGGNPSGLADAGPTPAYCDFLNRLADRGHVAMKSAIDEWADKNTPAERFFPYWDAMLAAGGFDWLLFETNFPVCLESGDYESAEEGFCDAVGRQLLWLYDRHNDQHLAQFFWENAQRWYAHRD